MKKNKVLAVVMAFVVCIMGNAMSASAEQINEGNNEYIVAHEVNYGNEINPMIIDGKVQETQYGEFTVKQIETIYTLSNSSVMALSGTKSAYSGKHKTIQYTVYYGKTNKPIFHIVMDVEFKYNNSNAYVSSSMVDSYVYNGASFSGNVHKTTYKNRGSVANLTVTGNISGKMGGKKYKEKWQFGILCNKNGKLSSLNKKLS